MRVLVVDDDVELIGLLQHAFARDGYEVVTAFNGEQALQHFDTERPDIVVLDVNLPKLDGYGVLAELRRRSAIPVMMLTVRSAEDDEVRGLDLGADDYLRKPFSPRALLARVRALLRRGGDSESMSAIDLGPIMVDPARAEARIGSNATFKLSALEMRLLHVLGGQAGRPVETERILSTVWSDREDVDREALKQLVHRLRAKFAKSGGSADWIEYVAPAGYAFSARAGPLAAR